jgi:NAD(P)-dependent dehydrogenase (short-subunit alcohol dehydrogenase family)
MRFENKSVIITGGGGKIGKAYALGFAKEGARVALPDIASADPVVRAIRDMGGTAISMACDVSNEQSVKAMVDQTVKEFGTVDILINNAAYFMTVWKGPFWEMTVEEFDKAMAVNVRGAWLCARPSCRICRNKKRVRSSISLPTWRSPAIPITSTTLRRRARSSR